MNTIIHVGPHVMIKIFRCMVNYIIIRFLPTGRYIIFPLFCILPISFFVNIFEILDIWDMYSFCSGSKLFQIFGLHTETENLRANGSLHFQDPLSLLVFS